MVLGVAHNALGKLIQISNYFCATLAILVVSVLYIINKVFADMIGL